MQIRLEETLLRKKIIPILLITALLSLLAIPFASADSFGQILD